MGQHWTERWMAHAQRRADARDERFRRRQTAVRAGTARPGLADVADMHQQAADARRREMSQELLRGYPELSGYDEVFRLNRIAAAKGPDGVAYSVWYQPSGRVWADLPAPPSRWPRSRAKRSLVIAWYYLTLPPKLLKSRETFTACAYGPAGSPHVTRRFLTEMEARVYTAALAKRIEAGGVEALRREAEPSGRIQPGH
jgi:hypothetical protein